MTLPDRIGPASLLLLAGGFLIVTLCLAGKSDADPAQVGTLFATGRPEALKDLKLIDEAKRLTGIGRPDQAEALIYQTLKRYPIHPEALDAIDYLINLALNDRSVPDDDRIDAVRQACKLGIEVAQTWVTHHGTDDKAALADLKRIDYQLRMDGDTPKARSDYVRELNAFLQRHAQSDRARSVHGKLARAYMDSGRFREAVDFYEQLMKQGGRAPARILGLCYYEIGDFEKAARYLGADGRAAWRGIPQWRDLAARMNFYLGKTDAAMKLVRAGALQRKSGVFVHVESDWLDVPRFRKTEPALELPPGADWAADVSFQIKASYKTDSPDLTEDKPAHLDLNMTLQVEPLVINKAAVDYALSTVTPVALETTVPYGAARSEVAGYRTTWPGRFAVTPDNWVNVARIWAQSRRGVLRNPACRVWRTSKVLYNNRVQVDIFLSTTANAYLTIDHHRALIEKSADLPEGARVVKNRTIQMEVPAGLPTFGGTRPEKPVCSYVAVVSDVKRYLPTVTVIHRVKLPGDTAETPPNRNWHWDIGGHVLELQAARPLWVRKITVAPTFRYVLNEIVEAAP